MVSLPHGYKLSSRSLCITDEREHTSAIAEDDVCSRRGSADSHLVPMIYQIVLIRVVASSVKRWYAWGKTRVGFSLWSSDCETKVVERRSDA